MYFMLNWHEIPSGFRKFRRGEGRSLSLRPTETRTLAAEQEISCDINKESKTHIQKRFGETGEIRAKYSAKKDGDHDESRCGRCQMEREQKAINNYLDRAAILLFFMVVAPWVVTIYSLVIHAAIQGTIVFGLIAAALTAIYFRMYRDYFEG